MSLPCHEKNRYGSRESASWFGAYSHLRDKNHPDLYTYKCPHCGWYHLTRQKGGGNVPVMTTTELLTINFKINNVEELIRTITRVRPDTFQTLNGILGIWQKKTSAITNAYKIHIINGAQAASIEIPEQVLEELETRIEEDKVKFDTILKTMKQPGVLNKAHLPEEVKAAPLVMPEGSEMNFKTHHLISFQLAPKTMVFAFEFLKRLDQVLNKGGLVDDSSNNSSN